MACLVNPEDAHLCHFIFCRWIWEDGPSTLWAGFFVVVSVGSQFLAHLRCFSQWMKIIEWPNYFEGIEGGSCVLKHMHIEWLCLYTFEMEKGAMKGNKSVDYQVYQLGVISFRPGVNNFEKLPGSPVWINRSGTLCSSFMFRCQDLDVFSLSTSCQAYKR